MCLFPTAKYIHGVFHEASHYLCHWALTTDATTFRGMCRKPKSNPNRHFKNIRWISQFLAMGRRG